MDVSGLAMTPGDLAFSPVVEIPSRSPTGLDATALALHAHGNGGGRLAEVFEVEQGVTRALAGRPGEGGTRSGGHARAGGETEEQGTCGECAGRMR